MADPGHREGQVVLIAAFGNEVKIVVSVENAFGPATVTGIGVKNAAALILVKDADSWRFRAWEFHQIEVIVNLVLGHLLRGERSAVVVVEVGSVRRDPCKPPAQALFKRFDFGQGGS